MATDSHYSFRKWLEAPACVAQHDDLSNSQNPVVQV